MDIKSKKTVLNTKFINPITANKILTAAEIHLNIESLENTMMKSILSRKEICHSNLPIKLV